MGGGGKRGGGGRKGGGHRGGRKIGGGMKKAAKHAVHSVHHTTRRAGTSISRIGRSSGRAVNRAARTNISRASAGIRSMYMGSSIRQGVNIVSRKFAPFKLRDNRLFRKPGKPSHVRIYRYSNRANYNDPYYRNNFHGYHNYDSVNSYLHRHYSRIHWYRAPVYGITDEEIVSYDSVRVTLPPDSPNFCFISLAELINCGTPEEKVAIKEYNLRSKVKALFYRPMGSSVTSGVAYTPDTEKLIDMLLDHSGTVLRNQRSPEDAGSWVPDWMTFGGCCAGGTVIQRKIEFCEDELECAVEDIITYWNKNAVMAAAGAAITYADIGNAVLGFTVEVLPCLPLTTSLSSCNTFPYEYYPGTKPPPLRPNPHFLLRPSSYRAATGTKVSSSADMLAASLMAQVARGQDIPENAYDSVMTAAAEAYGEEGDMVAAAYYTPFVVSVPASAPEGAVLTVVNPQDGFLLNVTVPPSCPPGTQLLVTLPNITNSDVVASPFSPVGGRKSTSAIAEVDSPPAHAEVMYYYRSSTKNSPEEDALALRAADVLSNE